MLVGCGKKTRTHLELMQIGTVAGLVLDASGKDVAELMQIAAVCGGQGHTLFLKNCASFETADLMKIGAAGSGHVVVEF
ncbi:MAG: hypothetical protein JWM16_529 [Verrucomicrobiales bacterium]|nr:hypothetical protein [Verrucomicrobiales bacterium]